MRIGLTITVRNEQDLLRANLTYHRELGIDRAFVYFDGTTDGTEATVRDLPFVECARSVNPARFQPASHLRALVREAGRHHTARQVLNTCDALRRSRAAGLEWLIALDADELICPSTESV
ncbi:MAG: glycosyltransferase family 2 protein, partial [bacterium]|nr:glycosyltransferase family 2 protein [bacterium]